MVLAFAGFFRCEEALKLRRSDLAFHTSYLAVFIESSKTDIAKWQDSSHRANRHYTRPSSHVIPVPGSC